MKWLNDIKDSASAFKEWARLLTIIGFVMAVSLVIIAIELLVICIKLFEHRGMKAARLRAGRCTKLALCASESL